MLTIEQVNSLIIELNRRLCEVAKLLGNDNVFINGTYTRYKNEYNMLMKLTNNLYNLKLLYTSNTPQEKFNSIRRFIKTTASKDLYEFYLDNNDSFIL